MTTTRTSPVADSIKRRLDRIAFKENLDFEITLRIENTVYRIRDLPILLALRAALDRE